MATAEVQVLDKALSVLAHLQPDAPTSLMALSSAMGIPIATMYRIAKTLERRGFLLRLGRDQFSAGSMLLRVTGTPIPNFVLAGVARPLLRALSAEVNLTAQIGILDNDMVTYLAKAGKRSRTLFTREGMQLEAYCSAIGKVLLSDLSDDRCNAYLADGPFVGITSNTITDPLLLRAALEKVRREGYAIDREEIEVGLCCAAVPVRSDGHQVIAALSLSGDRSAVDAIALPDILRYLGTTATALENKLFPARSLPVPMALLHNS